MEHNNRSDSAHVEEVVEAHCATFEALKHFEGVLVIRVPEDRVVNLRVERIPVWDLLLIHLIPSIHVLLSIRPLTNHQPPILSLNPVILLAEV